VLRRRATVENGVIGATGLVGPAGIQLDRAHGTTLRRLWVVGFRIERGPFYGHGPALRLLGSDDNRVLENAFVSNSSRAAGRARSCAPS
jgi:hypothetical protein